MQYFHFQLSQSCEIYSERCMILMYSLGHVADKSYDLLGHIKSKINVHE